MSRLRITVLSLLAAVVSTAGLAALAAAPAGVATATQLRLLKTIQTGATGNWDYIGVDSEARRVYIPRGNHLQVLDLEKDAVVGDITGMNGLHGVALALEQNLGFATNGSSSNVAVFDLKTLKIARTIKTGASPDAITFDPASKHIFSINHRGGDITVIDPAALDKDTVTIPVGGTLEFAVADGKGHIFINVEDKSEVVEVDTAGNRVLAHWSLAPGTEPTGLAIDTEHHRLFSGCAESKTMVILDSESGKIIGSVPTGNGVDGVAFEPTLGIAMSANGRDGTITVVKETAPGKFEAVQTVKSISGARTINIDAKLHHALLPCNVSQGTFGLAVVGAE